jgi:antitoxin (DNA-binding transcriptional repressor) of toxin-antitoxin stability system
MTFSTDEFMPSFEVRTRMSKQLSDVQARKEIVITRHGKLKSALLSVAQLFCSRKLGPLITVRSTRLNSTTTKALLTLTGETGNWVTQSGVSRP